LGYTAAARAHRRYRNLICLRSALIAPNEMIRGKGATFAEGRSHKKMTPG